MPQSKMKMAAEERRVAKKKDWFKEICHYPLGTLVTRLTIRKSMIKARHSLQQEIIAKITELNGEPKLVQQ